MSFNTPNKAIPINIYSRKAVFAIEKDSNSESVADEYLLRIRKKGTNQWIEYNLSSEAVYFTADNLSPSTIYETQWILTLLGVSSAPDETNSSTIYEFRTRYNERFKLRPAIPTPLYGMDFPNALQGEFDAYNDLINTIDEERAIERQYKEGTGKFYGCDLYTIGGSLYITNGWMQATTASLATNEYWYIGARVFNINGDSGYKEIEIEEDLTGEYYGYLGVILNEYNEYSLSILWDTTLFATRPNFWWCIGKVTFSNGGVIAIDNTSADKIPKATVINNGGGGGETGGGSGQILNSADDLKFNPNDNSLNPQSTYAWGIDLEERITDYVDEQVDSAKGGQNINLEFAVKQLARLIIGQGEDNPKSLTRIDGSFVIPEKYGMVDTFIDLDGDDVNETQTPIFEGEGDLLYDEDEKMWVV